MNKSDFVFKFNGVEIECNDLYANRWDFEHIDGIDEVKDYLPSTKRIVISPSHVDKFAPVYNRDLSNFYLCYNSKTPWTKENYNKIKRNIKSMVNLWKKEAKQWKKDNPKKVRAIKLKNKIFNAIHEQEIDREWGNDSISVFIKESIYKKRDMKKYFATGDFLALISRSRTREYAKSCMWKSSSRVDYFIIGQNENGNSFIHQVPNTVNSLKEAYEWIWKGNKIIYRQGDIGLCESNLKKAKGEENDIDVLGHSRHRFIGEVRVNGSIHVKNGFLYHTGEQHPTIYLDSSKWYRVVEARRSEIGMSSAD